MNTSIVQDIARMQCKSINVEQTVIDMDGGLLYVHEAREVTPTKNSSL